MGKDTVFLGQIEGELLNLGVFLGVKPLVHQANDGQGKEVSGVVGGSKEIPKDIAARLNHHRSDTSEGVLGEREAAILDCNTDAVEQERADWLVGMKGVFPRSIHNTRYRVLKPKAADRCRIPEQSRLLRRHQTRENHPPRQQLTQSTHASRQYG